MRDLGRRNKDDKTFGGKPYDFITPGHNLRLNNILASIGISQLAKIEKLIAKRSKNVEIYQEKLAEISEIKTFCFPEGQRISYQIFPFLAERRDELSEFLTKNNIGNRVYFESLANSFCYRKFKTKLPVTDAISRKILAIPFYTNISKNEIIHIVGLIKQFYQKK
jgi:dTDP-4-amino-4,6-dideoxygalactose transaminase